jgi:hypothetical protein
MEQRYFGFNHRSNSWVPSSPFPSTWWHLVVHLTQWIQSSCKWIYPLTLLLKHGKTRDTTIQPTLVVFLLLVVKDSKYEVHKNSSKWLKQHYLSQ